MIEIMPIPGDPDHNNARRFLRLRSDQLLANHISELTIARAELNPGDAVAVARLNNAFEKDEKARLKDTPDSPQFTTSRFIGAFETEDDGLRLVGGMRAELINPPFLRPIDRLATLIDMLKKGDTAPLPRHMGISALVAEASEDQPIILDSLIDAAIDASDYGADVTYLEVLPVDPVRAIAESKGFESIGVTHHKLGIPHVVLARGL